MALFYLLPPRPLLGDRLATVLEGLLPGLAWDCRARSYLADLLRTLAEDRPDVFVVYREDLPEAELPERVLVDGYGAEPGDEVIEVRPGVGPGAFHARRWRIAG